REEVGYVAGSEVDIAYRYADGDLARAPALADEMVRLKPDVVVTSNTQLAIAMKQATTSIPIVAANITDPVAFGLVASHARPGGERHRNTCHPRHPAREATGPSCRSRSWRGQNGDAGRRWLPSTRDPAKGR